MSYKNKHWELGNQLTHLQSDESCLRVQWRISHVTRDPLTHLVHIYVNNSPDLVSVSVKVKYKYEYSLFALIGRLGPVSSHQSWFHARTRVGKRTLPGNRARSRILSVVWWRVRLCHTHNARTARVENIRCERRTNRRSQFILERIA